MELTQEYVRALFDYRDGELFWRVNRGPAKIGYKAGVINPSDGRMRLGLDGKRHSCSRIIFLWHNGYLPECVDHIDRNPINDRIENLRAATIALNNKNRTSAKGSSSKYLGVNLKRGFNWQSRIRVDNKSKYLGVFSTQEEAALAYNRSAVFHHGEFANLNIIKPNG